MTTPLTDERLAEIEARQRIKVHSGGVCLCDIGIAVGHKDIYGKDLHTGDIVILYSVKRPGTDIEEWTVCGGLTVVVAGQYTSYIGGHIELSDDNPTPFVMGIKDCGFIDPEWRIMIVKKYSDVIDGEHWEYYGFCYRHNDAAEKAKREGFVK